MLHVNKHLRSITALGTNTFKTGDFSILSARSTYEIMRLSTDEIGLVIHSFLEEIHR